MRVVMFAIVCLIQSVAFAQTPISEKEFIDIVNLKDPERVNAMEDQLYRVTGYCFFKDRMLMIRPLGKPAEIVVQSADCCWFNLPQEVAKRIKKQGSKQVKVTIQGYAKSRLQETRIKEDYEQPSVFSDKDGKLFFEGDLSKKELESRRFADAKEKGMLETVPVTRLWQFYDARLVITLKQARDAGIFPSR